MKKIITISAVIFTTFISIQAKAQLASSQPITVSKQVTAEKPTLPAATTQTVSSVSTEKASKIIAPTAPFSEQLKLQEPKQENKATEVKFPSMQEVPAAEVKKAVAPPVN